MSNIFSQTKGVMSLKITQDLSNFDIEVTYFIHTKLILIKYNLPNESIVTLLVSRLE